MRITLNDLVIPKHDQFILDVLDHKYTRYRLYGGRGGAKSSAIPIGIILTMIQPENKNIHAIALRKVSNTIKDSIYAQFCFAISLLGMDNLFKKTISPFEITYKKTGQKILFRGLDDAGKIKSIKSPFGYFGITWFEEIDQYHGRQEIEDVLRSTMRGKNPSGDTKFWHFESFNPPISASNWANKDLLIDYPDSIKIQTDYRDVPVDWLSQQFYDDAEFLKSVNEKAYNHIYLGVPVGNGGNVFENIKIRQITDEEIKTFDWLYFGNDWGYYPDPNHFGGMYYNSSQRKLYIFIEIRCWKTKNIDYAEKLKAYKNVRITADSADVKSIADFRDYGFDMRGAIKGPGSIEYGTKWLQSLNEIIIDNIRCPYTAEEFLNYEYLRDKDGAVISGYPDKDNHSIDMVRYAMEEVWRRKGQ